MFGKKKQPENTADTMQKGEDSPVLPWIYPDEQTSKGDAPAAPPEKIPEVDEAEAGAEETAGSVSSEGPAGSLTEGSAMISTQEPSEGAPTEPAWSGPAEGSAMISTQEPSEGVPTEPAWSAPAEETDGSSMEEPEEIPPTEPAWSADMEDTSEEEEYKKPKKKKHGPIFIWGRRLLFTALILAATFLMTFFYSLWRDYSNDRSYEGRVITVEIPKGSTIPQIAELLKDAGVTRYKTTFVAKAFFKGYRGKLKYGIYKLNDGSCLSDILEQLTVGGSLSDETLFTVPEGYSVEMIADKLEKEKIMTSEEFLTALDKAAADFEYADQLPPKNKVFYQLQGYLFPDTYHITDETTADQLVRDMLDTFTEKFDAGRQAQAKKIGMSVEEVLVRASMVQKESDRTEDYARIAGVINNRLNKKMKIQFDSTVVYAMSNGLYGVERVTHDNLKLESPYNTYYIKGLPPGPICNPGLSAIDGVLNAEKHKYLFFRSDPNKDDGSNIFTETYEEHNAVSEDSTGGQ